MRELQSFHRAFGGSQDKLVEKALLMNLDVA
jgi:hypothetical protein